MSAIKLPDAVVCPGCGGVHRPHEVKNECHYCGYLVEDRFPTIAQMMERDDQDWHSVDLPALTRSVLGVLNVKTRDLPEVTICPGCGNDPGTSGRKYRVCGYEITTKPYRFLTLPELARHTDINAYDDVNVGAFLRALVGALSQRERDSGAILRITVELKSGSRPSDDELRAVGYQSEIEYWIDLVYADPPLVLDGATFEIIEAA